MDRIIAMVRNILGIGVPVQRRVSVEYLPLWGEYYIVDNDTGHVVASEFDNEPDAVNYCLVCGFKIVNQ